MRRGNFDPFYLRKLASDTVRSAKGKMSIIKSRHKACYPYSLSTMKIQSRETVIVHP
jgi:hypothetical protein